MDNKRTAEEHATRLGRIVGPIVDRTNMGWHEEMIKKLGKMDTRKVELKKDVVWKEMKDNSA